MPYKYGPLNCLRASLVQRNEANIAAICKWPHSATSVHSHRLTSVGVTSMQTAKSITSWWHHWMYNNNSHGKQGHHHNGDRTTQRPHILCSINVHSVLTSMKAAQLFIASLNKQPMYRKMCTIDIFVNVQPVGWNLKGGLFDSPV